MPGTGVTQTGITFFGYSRQESVKICGTIMLTFAVFTALGAYATFCCDGNLATAGSVVLYGSGGALAIATAIFCKVMWGNREKSLGTFKSLSYAELSNARTVEEKKPLTVEKKKKCNFLQDKQIYLLNKNLFK